MSGERLRHLELHLHKSANLAICWGYWQYQMFIKIRLKITAALLQEVLQLCASCGNALLVHIKQDDADMAWHFQWETWVSALSLALNRSLKVLYIVK